MAKKKYFIPNKDDKKGLWIHNFQSKLPTYKTKYNRTSAETDDMTKSSLYFNYWLNVLKVIDTFKQGVTAFKNELRDGIPAGATALSEPVLPTLDPPPAAVDPGIFPRASSIGASIKKHKDYVISEGEDMGLEGAELDPPDLVNSKPEIKLVLIAGRPVVMWKKLGYDALYIEVDRGSGYAFLAIDTEPDYVDTFALPPAPQTWKYRAYYRLGDDNIGQLSDEVSIMVKG